MDIFFSLLGGVIVGAATTFSLYNKEIAAGKNVVAAGKHAADVAVQKAHDAVATVKTNAVAAISKL